eukprot:s1093_g8.t1
MAVTADGFPMCCMSAPVQFLSSGSDLSISSFVPQAMPNLTQAQWDAIPPRERAKLFEYVLARKERRRKQKELRRVMKESWLGWLLSSCCC